MEPINAPFLFFKMLLNKKYEVKGVKIAIGQKCIILSPQEKSKLKNFAKKPYSAYDGACPMSISILPKESANQTKKRLILTVARDSNR